MNTIRLIIHLSLFLFIAPTYIFATKVNPETELKQQEKDFALFRKALYTIESKLDRRISIDSIEKVLDFTENAFRTTVLTALDEFRLYARCINLIQSGHTQAVPTKAVLKEYVLKAKSLPFDMVMVNKHLYVSGYEPPKGKSKNVPKSKKKLTDIPVGAEIIAIDGLSIAEWMTKIGQFIGSDEDEPVFEYFVAGQAFDFYRFLATEEHPEQLSVDYLVKRDTLAQTIQLTYPPLKLLQARFKAAEIQQEKDQKSLGTMKFIGSDVAYFRFPSFASAFGKGYTENLIKQFKKIKKKKKIETVVIDLRGNGGGNVQSELLSYFMEPAQIVGNYQIEKRLTRRQSKHIKKNDLFYRNYRKNIRQFKKMEKKFPDFKGQLITYPVDTSLIFHGNIIVLTDEATFSAASLLASQLKTFREAQIMGSRAGGSYYACNAGTLTFELPHSGIRFILNPNSCTSTLDTTAIDPNMKDVDVEIVPEYDPKKNIYKKNWEAVVKTAIKNAPK